MIASHIFIIIIIDMSIDVIIDFTTSTVQPQLSGPLCPQR